MNITNPLAFELYVDFLLFFVYSFIGWLYESNIWAKCEKKCFMNRGMLLGPVLPIYGLVSLFDWYLLGSIQNTFLLFIAAAVICSLFELAVSVLLERIFHRRWWDYSYYPLNFHGRISVPSAMFFGFAGVLLVDVIHPSLLGFVITYISYDTLKLLDLVIFLLLLTDIFITSASLLDKSKRIGKIYNCIEKKLNVPFDLLNAKFVPIDDYFSSKILLAKERFKIIRRN
ncbi:MAG: putative ABC transporter permease [Treponema sp.]|nr:putative ABC transporter permease [Treponema sp.]